jgi:hypothetical protein
MPLYGLIDGQMQRPGMPEPRRSKCPECGATLIAKTGTIVVWHWAHEHISPDCPYAGESAWHLAWKARGLDGTQEAWHPDLKRRADVYSPAGIAVEFQHSRLSKVDVIARERDWEHRVCWIFDASHDYRSGQIELYDETLRWYGTPQMILAAVRPLKWAGWGCRTFLDLGTGMLWYGSWREAFYGENWESRDQVIHGFPVTEEAVTLNVLRSRSATALAAMSLRMDLWLPPLPAQEVRTG